MSQRPSTNDAKDCNTNNNSKNVNSAITTTNIDENSSTRTISISSNSSDEIEILNEQHLSVVTTIDLCNSPSTSAAAALATSNTNVFAEEGATATSIASEGSSCSSSSGACSLLKNETDGEVKNVDEEPSSSTNAAPLECPICLQTCIHPARLPCGHIFCFLCVKGVAYKNRRCAMCRREIPPEFLDHPQLVNGIDDICSTKSTEDGYQWYYEGRNGWWQYDDRTSQDIEESFKSGETSCSILVAGYVYIVDFEALVQLRQNDPSRCRRVKRDLATIPKKGVAGLRIEGNTVTTDSNFATQVYQQQQQQPEQQFNSTDIISTLAVTDAAIRIASDIIGSTLAHADELQRSRALAQSNNDIELPTTSANSLANLHRNSGATASRSSSSMNTLQDIMRNATEDLLDTTQHVIDTNQHSIDLFEQALNDFQALTLHNIADSSEDEQDENVPEP